MTVISVNNLYKSFQIKTKTPGLKGSIKSMISPSYRNIEAVKDISFKVDRGEILAFIGPNGAGKSTTIKILTGILYPTNGEVSVLGFNPLTERKKLSYKIGTVFGQKSQLWFHLPPIDSFNLLGKIYDMEEDKIKKRIGFLKEVFEIEELMDVPVRKLSLGQRIRCEIAASLIHNPEIIFLDEPTIGLDVIVKQNIRDLILRINKEENRTIFLTSHDAGDIEQLCRRAIVINHGQVVLNESIKALKYNYLNKKIIEVKFKDQVNINENEFKVLKSSKYGGKIEIDTENENIDEALAKLIRYGSILDINILEPPMEEIISHIYKNNMGGV